MAPRRPDRPHAASPEPPNPWPAEHGIDLDERKERVLHTRVPQSLDRRLKHRARNLGLSVSTVVRHVLLNTFGLVEDIVTDSTNIALSIAGEETAPEGGTQRARERRGDRGGAEEGGGAAIVGWQEAILNLNAVCDHCNAVLRKGARAAIGVREGPGRPSIICARCLIKVGGGEIVGPERGGIGDAAPDDGAGARQRSGSSRGAAARARGANRGAKSRTTRRRS